MSLAMIDVHDLLGHPGLVRSYDLLGTIDGLATELVAVPDDAVLGGAPRAGVRRSKASSSPARSPARGACGARDASPSDRSRSTSRSPSCSTQTVLDAGRDADDDGYVLVEEQVDLDQIVRDAVGVEMPFAPLCRPDCQGLCPIVRRQPQPRRVPGARRRSIPRFAVLSDLLLELPTTDDPA